VTGTKGRVAAILVGLAVLAGVAPATAGAVDPGKWIEAGYDPVPLEYFQGVTSDPQRNLFLGLALATLGRKAEAIAAAERGDQFQPLEKDQNNGPYMRHQLIRVYLVLGENDKALDMLESLVKIPYYLTPQYLSIDPNFAQLRGNPRFEKLLRE